MLNQRDATEVEDGEGKGERRSTEARPFAIAPSSFPFSVSVVIPARDESGSIERVLAGIRAQLPEAELLVVDDGSADDTAARARAAGARVVRHPQSKGVGAGVKTG